ncbi:hypothetical protein ACIBK8_28270 [Streptomyces sp. NPDC050161]|uniref:hypothetical protein n=1 Tax=Streptomyces sp. NPDC050161 TaxID=3365604 RepID=UPI0037B67338
MKKPFSAGRQHRRRRGAARRRVGLARQQDHGPHTQPLLYDDTLKAEDRLAGLLLVLYAQEPSAIHRLTTEDVEVGAHEVRLNLGNAPVHLPEPVADLARAVAVNRKGRAIVGALAPSPWLFPRSRPGRPISPPS